MLPDVPSISQTDPTKLAQRPITRVTQTDRDRIRGFIAERNETERTFRARIGLANSTETPKKSGKRTENASILSVV